MVSIIFEPHSTSEDNEAKLASGWADPNLSEEGKKQAKELGERYRFKKPNAVFCSDMERAYQTVVAAFGNDPRLIFVDWRLRECDYGDFTRKPKQEIENQRLKRIQEPFPNGESYQQVIVRMKSFLTDLKKLWDGKTVVIVGHRATHYGLEHLINGKSLEECIKENWSWQPGWKYKL